jgi:hypothetical protein
VPNDGLHTYSLKESTTINSYINISAFTDIKGLSGDANGLAQFYADLKFITRTRNIPNTTAILLNHISFQGGISKFDNDFKGTELMSGDSINRSNLLQRSIYSVGIKANLIRVYGIPRVKYLFDDFQINVGYNFLGSRIMDTSFKDDNRTIIDTTYKTVTQNQVFIEPSLSFSRHKNISMKLSLPFYIISLKRSSQVSNWSPEYWTSPSILLMYFNKKDERSKIFFRYNHFINLSNSKQDFMQLQLGYSINLSEAWGGK